MIFETKPDPTQGHKPDPTRKKLGPTRQIGRHGPPTLRVRAMLNGPRTDLDPTWRLSRYSHTGMVRSPNCPGPKIVLSGSLVWCITRSVWCPFPDWAHEGVSGNLVRCTTRDRSGEPRDPTLPSIWGFQICFHPNIFVGLCEIPNASFMQVHTTRDKSRSSYSSKTSLYSRTKRK